MERVLIRSLGDSPTWSLVFEMAPTDPMTSHVARAILGDRVPVIGWDDSGPRGALVFPGTPQGYGLALLLRDQLNEAIVENMMTNCPAESFPEPGAPDDVDADDLAEPPGGESARVAAEEAAHLAALRAAKAAAARLNPDDIEHHRFGGWRSGDRFVVYDPDDVARHAAALHLWPTWGGKAAGSVITRCDRHHDGHDTSAGLLIDCEGLLRPIVVSPRVLSACAKKVTT